MKVVNHLKDDLTALQKMFNRVNPPKRIVQVKNVCINQYGFGDAPVSGCGASWEDKGGEKKYWKVTCVKSMYGKYLKLH